MPTLHVHLDESGDLNFSPKGTRYYVFTALLKAGHNIPAFHATSDRQVNRDAAVHILRRHDGWRFAAVVIEKAKVYPELREPHRFYPQFAASVLKYVFHRHVTADTRNVLVFTDTLPVKAKREAAEKAIKVACRSELQRDVRFDSYHHPASSNCWIQVADYCSWAVFRKWELGDSRTYERLGRRLAEPELDALRKGEVRHY